MPTSENTIRATEASGSRPRPSASDSAGFAFAIGVAAPAVIETVGLLAGPARGTAVSLFTFFLFTGAGIGPVVASAAAPYGAAALMYGVAGAPALGGGLVLIASSGRRIR
ncbi:hypothetical protein AB0C14_27670 [Microbispora hainanensis]|uniref:hypothetical protein n=1 Tax=Microbispora hainanensis TaxID=568844 RepID=UPI0033FB8D1C